MILDVPGVNSNLIKVHTYLFEFKAYTKSIFNFILIADLMNILITGVPKVHYLLGAETECYDN